MGGKQLTGWRVNQQWNQEFDRWARSQYDQSSHYDGGLSIACCGGRLKTMAPYPTNQHTINDHGCSLGPGYRDDQRNVDEHGWERIYGEGVQLAWDIESSPKTATAPTRTKGCHHRRHHQHRSRVVGGSSAGTKTISGKNSMEDVPKTKPKNKSMPPQI